MPNIQSSRKHMHDVHKRQQRKVATVQLHIVIYYIAENTFGL